MSNRRWLLLLPVAVVLVLLTSASRVWLFWWPEEMHDETTGRLGEEVELVDVWTDSDGDEHERELVLTVVSVEPATTTEGYDGPVPVEHPADVEVWEVVLELHADPDVPLGACRVSLLDAAGREADATGGTFGDVTLRNTSCEPDGQTGPLYDGSRIEGNEPRPNRYRVSVYAVTSPDFDPTAVRVWWEAPDYLEVSLDTGEEATSSTSLRDSSRSTAAATSTTTTTV